MVPPLPHQMQAVCTRAQAQAVVDFDHHRVRVGERWGLLITYPWMPLEDAPEPLLALVVFNPAPAYFKNEEDLRQMIFQHPLAPETVQQIIEALDFREIGSGSIEKQTCQ